MNMARPKAERGYLVLDIETVIDPELPIGTKVEQQPPALPPPPYHQVVVIGLLWMDASYKVLRIGAIGEPKAERQILADFVKFVEDRKPDLVTYNGRGFDLPVIAARCLRHGVPFGHYFRTTDVRYRFTLRALRLMDYMSDFGAARAVSLDTMAKLIGLPGKVGVDGKDVGPLVHAVVWRKWRPTVCVTWRKPRGCSFACSSYAGFSARRLRAAMEALIDLTANDARLAPVHTGIVRERLLLE